MENISYYDLIRSVEDEKSQNQNKKQFVPTKDNQGQQKSVFDKLKELPAKAENLRKNAQLWCRKRKNLGFYKKYLDRVEGGLYQRYAEEARIKENIMVDDPVSILRNKAQVYIRDIVADINKLYHTVLDMSKALENCVTAESAIKVVQKYCSDYIGQDKGGSKVDQDKLSWKEKIFHSTRYKIAKILLSHRDTGVYGYTAKNMVLKGFPKPNHLIVTLFVQNPEEQPQEQSVTDIFKSVNSFTILADSDKRDVFNVSNMTEAALSKTINGNVMNEIKLNKQNALAKFKNANIDNKKDEGKIIDDIWDGINASCRELLGKKSYLIDCINVYYEMILRIDKLAVSAIKEMLDVENAHRDTRYDKHVAIGHEKIKNNKYLPDDDPRSAAYAQRKKDERMTKTKNVQDITKRLNRM